MPLPTGEARITIRRDLANHYRGGATIRSLAQHTGYSYWAVRTLLLEAGVQLRERGGRLRKAGI